MTDALASAFGFEEESPKPRADPPRSPKWDKPAFQTLRPAMSNGHDIPVPEGWSELTSLDQAGVAPYDGIGIIRYREAMERKLRSQLNSRDGRAVFGRRYLQRDYTGYQLDLLDDYFTGGKYVWMVFTEGGKSTVGCVDFPIMSLAQDPNEPHTIVCTSESEAKNRLRSIKYHLENNHELLRDYPWLKRPRRGVWGATEINVDGRDSAELSQSVWACGRGNNQIKGHRAKTVFDDLEGKKSRDRSEVVEDMKRWFWTEAVRAYQTEGEAPRPLLAVQGTPFTVNSFYFDFRRREGWKVRRRPYQNPDGSLAWPRLKPKIDGFKKEMDRLEFSIAMELDPTGGDPNILSLDQIDQMAADLKPMPDGAGMFVTLDPGTQGGADYAGIAVVKYHWPVEDDLPYFNVFEPRAWYRDIYEQVQECRRLAHRFAQGGTPLQVIYEVNGRQKQDYGAMFQRFAPEIDLVPHWTNDLSKMDRNGFPIIKTMLRKGRLAIYASPSDADSVEGKDALLREIRDLGSSKSDHLIACIWFVFQHAFQQDRWLKSQRSTPTYRVENGVPVLIDRSVERPTQIARAPYFGGDRYIQNQRGRRFSS